MAYGTSGSAGNSRFPWGAGLEAARSLHQLAEEVDAADARIASATRHAMVEFTGPVADDFRRQQDDARESATRIAGALRDLAQAIAADWARERGNQDRTNFGRYVDAQIERDSMLENAWEFFAGEDDYGDPPGDPRTPGPPSFTATRAPMYSAYGP